MRPLIIDTDAGVDDAMAMLYVLCNGQFDVLAVTAVAGNVEGAQCARNALK